MVGKPMATRKLAHQLISTATDMAAGLGWKLEWVKKKRLGAGKQRSRGWEHGNYLGPWENSSAVIIQGMEPGPTAKNTT